MVEKVATAGGERKAQALERLVVTGNEAIGRGAIAAGCRHYFGYPITPQNDIPEFFARELPRIGGEFVQSEAECSSIAMVYGAAATGVRAMTSTSGPGWALMQEFMSHSVTAELPFVVAMIQRGGPGGGSTRHGQMDYNSVTRGGGNGDHKYIVLAPFSVQECFDFVQVAFHLADKYRNPAILLSDAILGQMAEELEIRSLEFDPLPPKDWAIRGFAHKGGRTDFISTLAAGWGPPWYTPFLAHINEKFQNMTDNEVRFQTYQIDDADLIMVAYGSTARLCLEVVRQARAEGLKVGLFRPITLWPFPSGQIRSLASAKRKFLVVEDSLGQMVDDVRGAVAERSPVHLLGALARHLATDGGMILPHRVFQEVRKLL